MEHVAPEPDAHLPAPPFLGRVGAFFSTQSWWYVGVYIDERTHWRPLYSRGPMLMTDTEADVEFVDTVEAFWQGSAERFMWKWVSGRGWVLWRRS